MTHRDTPSLWSSGLDLHPRSPRNPTVVSYSPVLSGKLVVCFGLSSEVCRHGIGSFLPSAVTMKFKFQLLWQLWGLIFEIDFRGRLSVRTSTELGFFFLSVFLQLKNEEWSKTIFFDLIGISLMIPGPHHTPDPHRPHTPHMKKNLKQKWENIIKTNSTIQEVIVIVFSTTFENNNNNNNNINT